MKTPSINTKGNTHRVKTHWSVYAHLGSICLSFVFSALCLLCILSFIPGDIGLASMIMLLVSLHIMKITKPVIIPSLPDESIVNDLIENEINAKHKEVRTTFIYFLLLAATLFAWLTWGF